MEINVGNMNKLFISLILLAALFTAGCTENVDKSIEVDNSTNVDNSTEQEVQATGIVENLTDLAQINTSIQTGPILVKVGATWCGECQKMKPILNELAAEYTGKATIMDIDIDQSPQLESYFATSYIPDSFVIVGLENGEYVYMQGNGSATTDRFQARVLGKMDTKVYEELLDKAVSYYGNASTK
jgi:thioredoxin-like negative regulator of GroEL